MKTIPDSAVEAAVALLEARGWERDEEMVNDVRDALAAAQAGMEAAAAAEAQDQHRVSERARRITERKGEAHHGAEARGAVEARAARGAADLRSAPVIEGRYLLVGYPGLPETAWDRVLVYGHADGAYHPAEPIDRDRPGWRGVTVCLVFDPQTGERWRLPLEEWPQPPGTTG